MNFDGKFENRWAWALCACKTYDKLDSVDTHPFFHQSWTISLTFQHIVMTYLLLIDLIRRCGDSISSSNVSILFIELTLLLQLLFGPITCKIWPFICRLFRFTHRKLFSNIIPYKRVPGRSRGKVLDYGLHGPGSISCVRGLEIFIHFLAFRLVLGSTQPHIKWVPGVFPCDKGGRS